MCSRFHGTEQVHQPAHQPFDHHLCLTDAAHGSGPAPLATRWRLLAPVGLAALLLTAAGVKSFFAGLGLRWMHVLLTAFCLSFCLTPAACLVARRWGIFDVPDPRKVHRRPTPLLGGAAVFGGFSIAILVNGIVTARMGAVLAAAGVLFAAGVIDDARTLPAAPKLLIQLACTAAVMAAGVVLRVLPHQMGFWASTGNVALTVLWVVGITNAMNFFDGMDGLAGGLGALIAFFLGVVAFQTGQAVLGWIAVAMLGACLGFLPFNFRPGAGGEIFLGDAGSTVIGFVLACLAVYGDWATADPVAALVSPLLVFGVLIFDMVHISVERVATGKVCSFRQWIDYVGKDHLHHRLARALGSPRRSVLFIYSMSACLGISAVCLRGAGALDAALLILQATIFVLLITFLERSGRQVKGAFPKAVHGAAGTGRRPEPTGSAAAGGGENATPY